MTLAMIAIIVALAPGKQQIHGPPWKSKARFDEAARLEKWYHVISGGPQAHFLNHPHRPPAKDGIRLLCLATGNQRPERPGRPAS